MCCWKRKELSGPGYMYRELCDRDIKRHTREYLFSHAVIINSGMSEEGSSV